MFSQKEIDEILDIIDHHYSLMIFTSLGSEALSSKDKAILEYYGVDITKLDPKFPPYYQMFLAGKLSTILQDDQFRQVSSVDFKKYLVSGQFIPPSERERAEYAISRQMTYSYIKGLANKVTDETRNKLLEQNKVNLIRSTISEGVKSRRSVQAIVSELGHKTGEWDRDWKRIVVTEMNNIFQQGRAATIEEKYGPHQLVYKTVFPTACRRCIKLYLTNGIGSQPRIFKLSTLRENGTNIGVKANDWKPILSSTHPYCRCTLHSVFAGQKWNETTQMFEYTTDRERKVIRTSKIKISVGDKEFFV
jgi:hypothetical protein